MIEPSVVPFGRSKGSLKQDLKDVLVPTLDRIKRAHDEITDAKGPERRMEYIPLAIAGYILTRLVYLEKELGSFFSIHRYSADR
jgi:hypothetical protein